VEPRGKWGAGRVELVQIPTPDETNDNIVAFWVPASPPNAKEPFDFEYRLLWQKEKEAAPPQSWVTQTRRGMGFGRRADQSVAFMVDFEGPALKKLSLDAKVQGMFSSDANGQVLESIAYRHDVTGGWRVALRVKRHDEKKPVELRGFLRNGSETLSETWSYTLPVD
jgi:glucans biosynthesis protein